MAAESGPPQKPIHSLVLDTGPLIKNAVSISTIIGSAEELFTTPAVLSEIRDEATRSRVQTTLMPFLKIRTPRPASYDAVIAFSKKTGDHAVLSRQDLGILALAYEIHCEKNGGDWGLRDTPGQPEKRRPGQVLEKGKENGSSQSRRTHSTPKKPRASETEEQPEVEDGWEMPRGKRAAKPKPVKLRKGNIEPSLVSPNGLTEVTTEHAESQAKITEERGVFLEEHSTQEESTSNLYEVNQHNEDDSIETKKEHLSSKEHTAHQQTPSSTRQNAVEPENPITSAEKNQPQTSDSTEEKTCHLITPAETLPSIADLAIASPSFSPQQPTPPPSDPSDSDSDGDWITPSNLSEHQAKDSGIEFHNQSVKAKQLDVAAMTIDFAMQNVLLQMNIHLLSTNMQRIKHISSKVLRCHACFNIVKQPDKQFCPRCGQASLQRVTCSTNAKGEFRIHLRKNYQWNTRGDKYTVPKPIHGTANGKWSGQGGGKGGWGRDLILAEDQKEYQRQMDQDKRNKARDPMDDDYLPGILTGYRAGGGGRPKVGAGKNVNSRKR